MYQGSSEKDLVLLLEWLSEVCRVLVELITPEKF